MHDSLNACRVMAVENNKARERIDSHPGDRTAGRENDKYNIKKNYLRTSAFTSNRFVERRVFEIITKNQ